MKEKKTKQKNNPRLVAAAARELKDCWLEQVNSGMYLPVGNGKYEVSRGVEQRAESGSLRVIERIKKLPPTIAA